MADLLSDTDDSSSSGNNSLNWEFFAVIEPDQEAVTHITDTSEALQMDYFMTSSTSQQTEGIPSARETDYHPIEETMNLAGSTGSIQVEKVDWIEPLPPYRSCTLSTDEEEDGTSRKSESSTSENELKPEALEYGPPADLILPLCTAGPLNSEAPSYSHMMSLLAKGVCGSKEKDSFSGTWWKRQFLVLQTEGGCANTLWSIAVAAAVVGLLILGHRLHRFQVQNKKLRIELDAKEKKLSQLMYQLIQAKECISCIKQIPVVRTQPTLFEHLKWQ